MTTDIPYVVGYEAKIRRLNGFEHALAAKDFDARYRRLVHNLDAHSVVLVDEIIKRLRLIFAANDGDLLDLYSSDEKKEIMRQRDELVGKTLCLSDELFFWGGCFLPIKSFETSVFFYRYGLDKVRTLTSIGDSAIIDAGGYVGDSAWLFSPLTAGRVYVFEPLMENIRRIRQTIAYNALANVEPVHAGLGEMKGTTQIRFADSTGCATISNQLIDERVRTENVQVVALDEFVREKKIGRVGLIKTDVEGAEQMLLAGAWQVIKRDRPILLISIYHNASDFFDIKPMIEALDLGYEFRIHHPPIKNISGETVLVAEVPQSKGRNKLFSLPRSLSAHERALLALGQYCTTGDRCNADQVIVLKQEIAKRDKWLAESLAKREVLSKKNAELRAALEKTRSDRDVKSQQVQELRASLEKTRSDRDAKSLQVQEFRAASKAAKEMLIQVRGQRDELARKLKEIIKVV